MKKINEKIEYFSLEFGKTKPKAITISANQSGG